MPSYLDNAFPPCDHSVHQRNVEKPSANFDPYSIPLNQEPEHSLHSAKEGDIEDARVFSTFPNYQNTSNYLVYLCDNRCGGFADRIKGVVTVYMLSVLSQRRFAIHWTKPFPLQHVLEPRILDWRFDPETVKGRWSQKIDYKEPHQMVKYVMQRNDVDLAKIYKADVIYMKANQDWTDMLRQLSIAPIRFKEIFQYSDCDITRIIYNGLFKLSPEMQQTVDAMFDDVGGHKLACLHARMGDVSYIRYKFDEIIPAMDFLKGYLSHNYKIMVASDSKQVKTYAKEAFGDAYIDTSGPIMHIDSFKVINKTAARDIAYDGFKRVLVDHAVLTKCDKLVLTKSGFGVLAGQLRHTSRGLYALYPISGVLPVRREVVREAFQYSCLSQAAELALVCDG